MLKWKFFIKIEILISHLRLGNMVYSNVHSIKSLSEFRKKGNTGNSDNQQYISQMSTIDIYV